MDNEKSVGTILSETRREKKISLSEVAKDTNIREAYLHALESDQYGVIPGEVFLRGMIRSYGNYLGIDGSELVDHYKSTVLGINTSDAGSRGIREVEHVSMRVRLKEKRDIGSGRGGLLSGFLPSCRSLVALILFLLCAAALWGAYQFLAGKGSENEKPVQSAPSAVFQSDASTAAATAGGNTETRSTVLVEIEALGECWLEVSADDKNIYEGLLKNNDKKMFEAADKLVIKYGNIGAVRVTAGGREITYAGEHGVAVKTYNK